MKKYIFFCPSPCLVGLPESALTANSMSNLEFYVIQGDGPAAAAKAGLASRTNTLFSGPMLLGMLGNKYLAVPIAEGGSATGLYVALGTIVALEINALFGGMGPMKSVMGVIHCSLALMLAILGILLFL